MTEEQRKKLWIDYKRLRTREIRDSLIVEYAPLVKVVAGKLSLYLGGNVDYDDLNGYGIFGLIDAIDKFDISANVKFETYATLRIRGSILDSIRKLDWVPRTLRQKQKQLESVTLELKSGSDGNVTDEKIAEKMGITLEELAELEQQLLLTNVISLDEFLVTDNGDNETHTYNLKQTVFETPEESYDKEELKVTLKKALDYLTDKERKVIEFIYYEDLTAKEISKVLEVSESRISQLHTNALKKLRSPMGKYMNILVNKEKVGL